MCTQSNQLKLFVLKRFVFVSVFKVFFLLLLLFIQSASRQNSVLIFALCKNGDAIYKNYLNIEGFCFNSLLLKIKKCDSPCSIKQPLNVKFNKQLVIVIQLIGTEILGRSFYFYL